jgi:hypothetical protein
MFIQGDVLAFVALLIGTCVSAWALTMANGLLFPGKSWVAQQEVSTHPWRCIGRGALVVLTLGLAGLILVGQVPNPLVKLFGWVLLLAIFSVAALGMAGVALNAGERLQKLAPEMNHYAAFSRGAAFLIVGCILPIVGWLAFGPALYLASIGAGFKAVFTRVEETSPMAHAETA